MSLNTNESFESIEETVLKKQELVPLLSGLPNLVPFGPAVFKRNVGQGVADRRTNRATTLQHYT